VLIKRVEAEFAEQQVPLGPIGANLEGLFPIVIDLPGWVGNPQEELLE
jgi:hypothetical protein